MSADDRCPVCAGTGIDPDLPDDEKRPHKCPACGGSGKVMPGQTKLETMRATVGPLESFRLAT